MKIILKIALSLRGLLCRFRCRFKLVSRDAALILERVNWTYEWIFFPGEKSWFYLTARRARGRKVRGRVALPGIWNSIRNRRPYFGHKSVLLSRLKNRRDDEMLARKCYLRMKIRGKRETIHMQSVIPVKARDK